MHVFFVCWLTLLLVNSNWTLDSPPSVVYLSFIAYDVVPDVVRTAPVGYAKVSFPSGFQAILGNVLTPTQVKDQPEVTWPASPASFYTLACVDPDATSRQNPNISEFKHWLVGNIPGNHIRGGEVLASYYPPMPPSNTGFHRYTFLVYRQKQRIIFNEPRNIQMTTENRTKFSVYQFSRNYRLEGPVAGNFYTSQFSNTDC